MQFHLHRFEELGADLLALCPQRQEHNQAIVGDLGLSFPVLRDAGNIVSSAFGLTLQQPAEVIAAEQALGLDLPTHNSADNWDLPIPARFVIDAHSQIRFAALHIDHRLRTEPLDCVDCIRAD